MPRPGVEITSRAEPTARSLPTDTGVAFFAGKTGTRPLDGSGNPYPVLVHSFTEYETLFGARSSAIPMYDSVQAYFREGGNRAWVSSMPSGATGTDVEYQDALDNLSSDLGPGQVLCPGNADPVVYAAMLAHAESHNRVALLDGPTTGDAAAMIAAGEALQTDTNARYGALFGPGVIIPGIAGGTVRTISPSAIVAGIIARNDVSLTANAASAGTKGVSLYALDVTERYTDQEYEDINEAGVNMTRVRYGTIENYGYRSLVDPAGDTSWLNFGNCRLNMEIVAGSNAIAERYVFSQIDGRGRTISDFGGELAALLVPLYEAGALFGATADDAFRVDVGSQVNTPTTIANGELHAVLMVRMSPFAELVVIEIVKVSTTEALAAPVTSVAA